MRTLGCNQPLATTLTCIRCSLMRAFRGRVRIRLRFALGGRNSLQGNVRVIFDKNPGDEFYIEESPVRLLQRGIVAELTSIFLTSLISSPPLKVILWSRSSVMVGCFPYV